ncbi:MAG TPA: PorV/PorQ family protein [Firmicutes bacterium]|nr:PorV/PorQ family protein [Bacillota bacterium]
MKKNIIAVIALFLLLKPVFAEGDYGTDSIFGAGAGSRAVSMGGAFAALADDSSAVFYNPAGLVLLEKQQASMMHYPLYEGVLYNAVTYGQPLLDFGTIGAGIYRIYVDGIMTYDENAFETGEMVFEQYKASLSYARTVNEVFYAGFNINMFSFTFDVVNAVAFGADAAVIYEPADFFRAGIVIHNFIKPEFTFGESREDMPQTYTAGILFRFKSGSFRGNFAADLLKGQESGIKYRLGAEAVLFDSLFLRGGYGEDVISFGGGIKLADVSVDYAFITNDYLGGLSRFTLSYDFGMTIPEQIEAREEGLREQVRQLVEKEFREKEKQRAAEYFKKAEADFKKKSYESALVELDRALEWDKDIKGGADLKRRITGAMAEAYYGKALADYRRRDYVSALEGFKKVQNTHKNYKDTNTYLGMIDERMGVRGDAGKLFFEGVESFVNKRYDEAIKKWNTALKADPGNKVILDYIKRARSETAKTSRTKALTAEQKERVRALYYEGLKKYTDGDLAEAIRIWRSAAVIDPEDVRVLRSIERARAEEDELKKRGIQ